MSPACQYGFGTITVSENRGELRKVVGEEPLSPPEIKRSEQERNEGLNDNCRHSRSSGRSLGGLKVLRLVEKLLGFEHELSDAVDYGLRALRSAGEDNRANAFVGDRDQTAREPA